MKFDLTYQPAYNCVGREQPGARALQNFLLAEIDKLDGVETIDSGIYNCRNIGNTGRKSTHSEGRAGDTGLRTAEGMWPTKEIKVPGIWGWCDRLIDHAEELGIQYVIYARKARKPGDVRWLPYGGASPHFDHIHWELTREAAAALTPEYVSSVLGTPQEQTFMLKDFIADAYVQARGYNPFRTGRDESGAFYWLRTAAAEQPDNSWTWGDCVDSFQLGVMVALLEAER